MKYLLTQLEPGDEVRYNYYLSELRRYDVLNHTRRDFFKHMAAKEGLQKYQQAGSFLRKYRPMFEGADPRWAGKGNAKLRATFAEKKRLSLATQAGQAEDKREELESELSSEDDPRRRMVRARVRVPLSGSAEGTSRNAPASTSGAQPVVSDDDEPLPRRRPKPRASRSGARRVVSDSDEEPRPSQRASSATQRARPSASARPSSARPSSPKRRRTEVIEIKSEPEDGQEPTPAPTPKSEQPEAVWHTIDQCAPRCDACRAGEPHRIPAASLRRLMRTETQLEVVRTENERLRNRLADREHALAEAETKLRDKERALRDKETIIELQHQLAAARR